MMAYDPDFHGYQQIAPEPPAGPDDHLPAWASHPASCGCPSCEGEPPCQAEEAGDA